MMSFDHWLKFGIEQGFCGEGLCIQHEGTPFTRDEEQRYENGDDPCVPVVRVLSLIHL